MPTTHFDRLLTRLMNEHHEGPLTIAALARKMGMQRSTIYKHLQGNQMFEATVQQYAKALGDTEQHREEIAHQIRRTLGMPDPGQTPLQDEISAINVELQELDSDGLDAIWKIVRILRASTDKAKAGRTGSLAEDPAAVSV